MEPIGNDPISPALQAGVSTVLHQSSLREPTKPFTHATQATMAEEAATTQSVPTFSKDSYSVFKQTAFPLGLEPRTEAS